MRRSVLALALTLVIAASAVGMALADSVDDEARRIGHEIQCPVCQGLSVSDSPSQLATQMRAIIRSKLEAGESREAILAYFVDRYGEGVLLTPPRSGLGVAIWLAPYLGAGAILALVFWMVQRRRATPPPSEPASDPALGTYLDEVDRAANSLRSQPLR